MIGISLGSLNTSVSYGKKVPGTSRIQCELLLSETSLRSSPSIISYTNSHRLASESANLVIKKHINSTFTNLSRLIGFNPNSEFSKKEFNEYTLVGGQYNPQKNVFTINVNGNPFELSPESVVVGFLDKVRQHYIVKQNIPAETFIFSVPDYFTCIHKDYFMNIIRASGFTNNVHLINESTAITLYYGYKNYHDYFVVKNISDSDPTKKGVDPTVVKYVIFIDAGYSKTSFIFSKLTHNVFTVLDSSTMPFFGGRNLDDAIFRMCVQKFKEKTGIDISKNKKIRIRMLDQIAKTRKALTVNPEMTLSFDSLSDDEDFSYVLKRAEFEAIIKNNLNEFQAAFKTFYEQCQKKYPDAMINNIEMAGELMRTPALQNIVKNVTGIEMSKRILTDECIAIGCSLYGSIMVGSFPVTNFQGIYHVNKYTITYALNYSSPQVLIEAKKEIPQIKTVILPGDLFSNQFVSLCFYHLPQEMQFYLSYPDYFLIEYQLISQGILNQCPKLSEVQVNFLIDNNGFVHINSINLFDMTGKSMPLQFQPGIIIANRKGLYMAPDTMKARENQLMAVEQSFEKTDIEYQKYFAFKNDLEAKLYAIRNKVNSKNLGNNIFQGMKLMDALSNIENTITGVSDEEVIDLMPIQNQLNQIATTFRL